MVEEKVYKVPNLTVDAIVTRSRLQHLLNARMSAELKQYAKDNSDFEKWTQYYE